jgi:hypothetical protein
MTSRPTTSRPETSHPEASLARPTTSRPTTSHPEASLVHSATSHPAISRPMTSHPETSRPMISRPATSHLVIPQSAQQDKTHSDINPSDGEPSISEPAMLHRVPKRSTEMLEAWRERTIKDMPKFNALLRSTDRSNAKLKKMHQSEEIDRLRQMVESLQKLVTPALPTPRPSTQQSETESLHHQDNFAGPSQRLPPRQSPIPEEYWEDPSHRWGAVRNDGSRNVPHSHSHNYEGHWIPYDPPPEHRTEHYGGSYRQYPQDRFRNNQQEYYFNPTSISPPDHYQPPRNAYQSQSGDDDADIRRGGSRPRL